MGDIGKGLEAGFIATLVITALLFAQSMSGLAPEFDLIAMLTQAAGTPGATVMGWIFHFVIGVGVWGAGFAVFSPHLPGPHWLRGLVFGLLAWLVMMIAFLPAANMPMFASGMGYTIPGIALMIHIVFGVVLGEAYHLLLHYLPSEVDENA